MKRALIRTVLCTATALLLATATTGADIDQQSLVTWLTFDEGEGRLAEDSAPHGQTRDTSELMGDATWAKDGVRGGAIRFPGKNGSYLYLKKGSNDIQAIKGGPHNRSTFSFWFRCDNKDRQEAVQTLFETGGYHNNINVFIYEGVLHVGLIGGYPQAHQPPQWINTKTNLRDGVAWALKDNTWHHFALTIAADTEPVPDGYRVYLDGHWP